MDNKFCIIGKRGRSLRFLIRFWMRRSWVTTSTLTSSTGANRTTLLLVSWAVFTFGLLPVLPSWNYTNTDRTTTAQLPSVGPEKVATIWRLVLLVVWYNFGILTHRSCSGRIRVMRAESVHCHGRTQTSWVPDRKTELFWIGTCVLKSIISQKLKLISRRSAE